MSRLLWIMLSVLMGWSTFAQAETLYVRPAGGSYGTEDGTSYANAFDGFADIAWGAGVGSVEAGDTLCVSGTHREELAIGGSGTASARITIKGNCADIPAGTITGADIESSWTGPDANGNYAPTVQGYTAPYNFIVDGTPAMHGSAATTLSDGEWFYVTGFPGEVYYHGNPSGHTIEIGARGFGVDGYTAAVSYIDVTGLTFAGTRYETISAAVIFLDCAYIRVTDNTFYHMWMGINFRGTCHDFLADGNTMYRMSDGIDADNEGTDLPYNAEYSNNWISGMTPVNTLAGTVANDLQNLENTHAAMDQECYAFSQAGSNVYVHDNYCENNMVGIYLLPDSNQTNYRIESNRLYGIAFQAINLACMAGCSVSGTIIGNIAAYGGWANAQNSFAMSYIGTTAGAPGPSFVFTNNLCYRQTNCYKINGSTTNSYATGVFSNNIGYEICENAGCAEGGFSSYWLNAVDWVNQADSIVNNNRWYQGNGNAAGWRKFDGTYRTTFSTYQSDVTPQDTNSVNGTDPMFMDIPDDFRLAPGSTFRRAGLGGYPCKDVRGRACYPDSPDIGPYQASSGDPATTRSAASTRAAAGTRSAATTRTAR